MMMIMIISKVIIQKCLAIQWVKRHSTVLEHFPVHSILLKQFSNCLRHFWHILVIFSNFLFLASFHFVFSLFPCLLILYRHHGYAGKKFFFVFFHGVNTFRRQLTRYTPRVLGPGLVRWKSVNRAVAFVRNHRVLFQEFPSLFHVVAVRPGTILSGILIVFESCSHFCCGFLLFITIDPQHSLFLF